MSFYIDCRLITFVFRWEIVFAQSGTEVERRRSTRFCPGVNEGDQPKLSAHDFGERQIRHQKGSHCPQITAILRDMMRRSILCVQAHDRQFPFLAFILDFSSIHSSHPFDNRAWFPVKPCRVYVSMEHNFI